MIIATGEARGNKQDMDIRQKVFFAIGNRMNRRIGDLHQGSILWFELANRYQPPATSHPPNSQFSILNSPL